ncbi:hypothetical protein DCC62_13205 [candidate division KSB1 bacterium]|nr:MAG: hypothetical protein DCC62_13205 [candidate division KSB1 bacterium]
MTEKILFLRWLERMLLSEKDAKTKWCPMARSGFRRHTDTSLTINRKIGSGKPDPDCLCLASDCMMWRAVNLMKEFETVQMGYCGLAGKPEEQTM